ncbi:MAG: thiosulfate oxidation carrier protein SoxY [Rhodobacteraceae bacterium]|jgi:sulfur-oxidizing protein SoxY|nr:thiosulfate oxidation carrier protein SoxY [Paracoccaceae bacterium]
MPLTRRGALALGAAAATAALLPVAPALAGVDDAVAVFTGGATPAEGGITLDIPEIAENGASVPVTVTAPGATAIALFATANPNPGIASFTFGPLAARPVATTRIRLAQSQDVIAVAKLGDGTFVRTTAQVMVTVGGCVG